MEHDCPSTPARARMALIPLAVMAALYPVHAEARDSKRTSATQAKPGAVNVGTVSKQAQSQRRAQPAGTAFDHRLITHTEILHSTQSIATVTPQQARIFGPNASATQALTIQPNVYVSGPNVGGVSNRATISIRGIKVGVTGYIGDLEYNGITGLFDGIPIQNTVEGQSFHTAETPIGSLLSGINTIYGPGNPRTRWFDSIGGTINFIPVQPSRHAYARAALSYGSFDTKIVSAAASTGDFSGWSAVLAAAYAHGNSFRTGADLPSETTQAYFKVRKHEGANRFSLGAYYDHNRSYRPNQIPITPVPGVTLSGLPNGPAYSEQTSGFYSALPNSVWQKTFHEKMFLLYGRQHLKIARHVWTTNLFWYRDSTLHHAGINNFYPPLARSGQEQTNWYTNTFGDKFAIDIHAPWNDIAVGGYVINATTNVFGFAGNPLVGYPIPQHPRAITDHTYTTTYASAFFQDHIRPLPHLLIVPGVDFMDFQTHFFQNSPSIVSDFYPSVQYSNSPSIAKQYQKVEPSVGVNYQLIEGVALYAQYSVTYQNPTAGNFNAAAGPLTDLGELYPVKSDDYEAGFKFSKKGWLGLEDAFADLNYFDDKLSNETIPVTSPTNPLLTIFSYGTATLSGVNLALDARVDRGWSGFANVGFLHGYYNMYFSTADNQYYNGSPVSSNPNITANAGVTYRKFFDDVALSATLFDQYYGRQYLFNNNTGAPSRQQLGGYSVTNFMVRGKTTALDGWVDGVKYTAFALNVTNLFGKRYNSTADITGGGYFNTNAAGYVIVNPGAPRAIYGTVSMAF